MSEPLNIPAEIEIKLKVNDFTSVRAALVSAGAHSLGTVRELNVFFDRPDQSLLAQGAGLRLRWFWQKPAAEPQALLTWKGPGLSNILHHRPSLDISVAPPDQMATLLEVLGFQRTLAFEKIRESWRLDQSRIELDQLPSLGNFVEIEGPADAVVLQLQRRLNLMAYPSEHCTYIALVERHLHDHPAQDNTLRFNCLSPEP